MGRVFDGGYADYTCVPAGQVIPFRSDLDWATLGAVPEMLLAAEVGERAHAAPVAGAAAATEAVLVAVPGRAVHDVRPDMQIMALREE